MSAVEDMAAVWATSTDPALVILREHMTPEQAAALTGAALEVPRLVERARLVVRATQEARAAFKAAIEAVPDGIDDDTYTAMYDLSGFRALESALHELLEPWQEVDDDQLGRG